MCAMAHYDDPDDIRRKRDEAREGDPDDDARGREGRRRHDGHRRRRHRRHHHGRKERVLHTRISDQLADDIRRLADDLRVPTSNLVRNVLEEVFTMVESVSEDVGELFDDVLDEAESARERVRRRADRSRRRARAEGEGASRRSHFDSAVEEELRRDEAAEAGRTDAGPPAAEEAPEVEHRPRKTFPDVLGWQPLVLNHARECASCGVDLPRGTHAYLGLGGQGMTDTTLCRACTGMRD